MNYVRSKEESCFYSNKSKYSYYRSSCKSVEGEPKFRKTLTMPRRASRIPVWNRATIRNSTFRSLYVNYPIVRCAPSGGPGSGITLDMLMSFFDNVQFMIRFPQQESTDSARLSKRK